MQALAFRHDCFFCNMRACVLPTGSIKSSGELTWGPPSHALRRIHWSSTPRLTVATGKERQQIFRRGNMWLPLSPGEKGTFPFSRVARRLQLAGGSRALPSDSPREISFLLLEHTVLSNIRRPLTIDSISETWFSYLRNRVPSICRVFPFFFLSSKIGANSTIDHRTLTATLGNLPSEKRSFRARPYMLVENQASDCMPVLENDSKEGSRHQG